MASGWIYIFLLLHNHETTEYDYEGQDFFIIMKQLFKEVKKKIA